MTPAAAVAGARSGDDGWLGELELAFQPGPRRTILKRRRHLGPFVVQSPFYPEGGTCHAYLLHPPGGLVGGDRLHLDVRCASGSHALLTTPAAGKIYRSAGPRTLIRQHLAVASGAALEFLPTETILFDGAHARARTHLELRSGARVVAWDAWVMGRPASGEGFDHGQVQQSLELSIDGRPLLLESNAIEGGGRWLHAPWGLGARPACVTLLACPADEHALTLARRATGVPGCDAAVTLVDGVLVSRAIAASLVALRRQMERWWQALRPAVIGREAVAPRVWAT